MCGIVGFRADRDISIDTMLDTIAHRGPDGRGTYQHHDIGIGHCRLSILDLSGGAQPMLSPDGRVVISFNGEIYNYMELRTALAAKGHKFQTKSDTEVLIHLYREFGTDMLRHLNGMFAFVIYDLDKDILFGARDRIGIKPLYYATNDSGLYFASEIKALATCLQLQPDYAGIALYLLRRYIPGERTAYRGILKLRPGYYFISKSPRSVTFHKYWELPEEVDFSGDPTQRFGELLSSSVKYRLISDVPLGVFLSGGIDSTTIVSTMAQHTQSNIKTFTLGFSANDEEVIESQRTAQHLNCISKVEYITPEDFALFPKLIHHMDGPYGDPILLPLYILSKSASKRVKVVLSGDGADETQLGYIHHETLASIQNLTRLLPGCFFSMASCIAAKTPIPFLDKFFNYPDSMGPEGRTRLQGLLKSAKNMGACYQTFANLFTLSELASLCGPELRRGLDEAKEIFLEPETSYINNAKDPLRALYLHDLKHWLPDNILTKYDKMTMACSIEGRAPFLDHRLVEFLASLPSELKIPKRRGKHILREHFKRNIDIPNRRTKSKKAFYFPINALYQEQFRSLFDTYTSSTALPPEIIRRTMLKSFLEHRRPQTMVSNKQAFSIASLGIWISNFNNSHQPENNAGHLSNHD